jgi:hypothetical protein
MPTKYTLGDYSGSIRDSAENLDRRMGILGATHMRGAVGERQRKECIKLLKFIRHDTLVLLRELKT